MSENDDHLLDDLIPLIYYIRASLSSAPSNRNDTIAVKKHFKAIFEQFPSFASQLPLTQYLREIISNHILFQEIESGDAELEHIDDNEIASRVITLLKDRLSQHSSTSVSKLQQYQFQTIDIYLASDSDGIEEEVDDHCYYCGERGSERGREKKAKNSYFSLNFDDLPPYEPLESSIQSLKACFNRNNTTGVVVAEEEAEEVVSKLLKYDLNDLIENPQWNDVIELFNSLLLPFCLQSNANNFNENLMTKVYCLCHRWLRGLRGHYQVTDLLLSLLQHLLLLPPLAHDPNISRSVNSSEVIMEIEERGENLSPVLKCRLLLVREIFGGLSDRKNNVLGMIGERETLMIVAKFFLFLSRHRKESSMNSMIFENSVMAQELSLIITSSTSTSSLNMIFLLFQSDFIYNCFCQLSSSNSPPLISLRVLNSLCLISRYFPDGHLSPKLWKHFQSEFQLSSSSSSTDTSSATSSYTPSEVAMEAIPNCNSLFSQIKDHHRIRFTDIFSPSTDNSTDKKESVNREWFLHLIEEVMDDVNDKNRSTDTDERKKKEISEELIILMKYLLDSRYKRENDTSSSSSSSSSSSFSLLNKVISMILSDRGVLDDSMLLLRFVKEFSLSDRAMTTQRTTRIADLLFPVIERELSNSLNQHRNKVFEELFHHLPSSTSTSTFHWIEMAIYATTSSTSSSTSIFPLMEVMMKSVVYYFNIFYSHRDLLFIEEAEEEGGGRGKEGQRIFYLMTNWLTNQLPLLIHYDKRKEFAFFLLHEILMKWLFYFCENSFEKVFQRDVASLIITLLPFMGRRRSGRGEGLYDRIISRMFSDALVAEDALVSYHYTTPQPLPQQSNFNDHRFFSLFEVLNEGMRFDQRNDIIAAIIRFYEDFNDEEEEGKEEEDMRIMDDDEVTAEVVQQRKRREVVINEEYLLRNSNHPSFPYAMKLFSSLLIAQQTKISTTTTTIVIENEMMITILPLEIKQYVNNFSEYN